MGANRITELGVCVLVDPDMSYVLHTNGTEGPQALVPWQTFWAEYLSAFGIANHIAKQPRPGEVVAVSGQYFRAQSPEQIRKLMQEHRVLLDGEAVEILLEMGCGDLIGAESAVWYPLNGGWQSYEQVTNGQTVYGLPQARMSAQAIYEKVESGDYLRIRYAQEPTELTRLCTPGGEDAGPGLCIAGNAVVFPYGHMKGSYQQLLNPVRRELMAKLLWQNRIVQVRDTQFVTLNHFPVEQGQMILLTNYATDDFEDFPIYLPFDWKQCWHVEHSSGALCPAEFERNGEILYLKQKLASFTSVCLLLK